MPRKAKKPCRYHSCPNLTEDSSGYCEKHKTEYQKTISRNYDKYLRNNIEHRERYGYQWRKLRALFLSRNPLCEMCRHEGRFTDATEVHHIKPLSEGGTNNIENLMALCKSCHSRITMTTENQKRLGR